MDCDSARATSITAVKIVPEGYEADEAHSLIVASKDPRGLPLDMLSLVTFLYEDERQTGPAVAGNGGNGRNQDRSAAGDHLSPVTAAAFHRGKCLARSV